jgi:magnesium chelatase subunit D
MRGTFGESIYPFSALVGQASMKRALILAAIHNGLGGVLIRGSKGAAKSTAVRALAAILPEIEVHENDPFRRAPGEEIPGAPLADSSRLVRSPIRIVNLPVGATDDRVVGSLNIERAIKHGDRLFEPGLLASAHRGILYIDEVNLLDDHLVDLLLDAAAMGVNHVEREGLTFRHPARFLLVGTMNPEEGELRPQLLDRFGLLVDVDPLHDPLVRSEVVRRRLAFEADPAAFRSHWAEADRLEGERIAKARELLPSVVVPEDVLGSICNLCAREGADGMRADLTIYKAAAALAAYEGRTVATLADVDLVSELALAHRRTRNDRPNPDPDPDRHDRSQDDRSRADREPETHPPSKRPGSNRPKTSTAMSAKDSSHPDNFTNEFDNRPGDSSAEPTEGDFDLASEAESFAAGEIHGIRIDRYQDPERRRRRASSGRSPRKGEGGAASRRGRYCRAEPYTGGSFELATTATIRAAAPNQIARGRLNINDKIEPLRVETVDLMAKRRSCSPRRLILFVVDASRSMGAQKRMTQTKGTILSLLVDAYQARDQVGLITFGGSEAKVALAPTRSVRVAARRLAELPIGGATPLARGLAAATDLIARTRRKSRGIDPLVVVLTDGRGNVPLEAGGDPFADALDRARILGQSGIAGLIVDTETGVVRLGRSRRLAEAWGPHARYRSLDGLEGAKLSQAVRAALLDRAS